MGSRRILFVAACLALITSAFSFQMRANISDQWAADFKLTNEVVGTVLSAAFLGMAVSMLIFSPLAEFLGLSTIMVLGWVCHLVGILGTLFASPLGDMSSIAWLVDSIRSVIPWMFDWFITSLPGDGSNPYWILWFSTFLVGCGNGLTEVWINPLAATLYPNEKTHKLNVLHAWWPGGLIIAGLIAIYAIDPFTGFVAKQTEDMEVITYNWRVKIGMLLIPMVLYGILCLGRRFPETERVEAKVPLTTTFLQVLHPLFLILAVCMLLTASTELGTNSWQESVLTRTTASEENPEGVSGTLIFVYTSMIMFVLRFFAGTIVEKISPVTMLMAFSVLTAGGLFAMSYANSAFTAFAAATVFGIGVAYYWPTMLGITAERFPKGGAMIIGLMGCVGNLAIAFALPQIGKIYDSYAVEKLPAEVRSLTFRTADGNIEKLVQDPKATEEEVETFLPKEVDEFLYPAGTQKINPNLTREIESKQLSEEDRKALEDARKTGAAFAFRRVAILPVILIGLFGLIALVDRLRGGYRIEKLSPSGG